MSINQTRWASVVGSFVLTLWIGTLSVMLSWNAIPHLVMGALGMSAIVLLVLGKSQLAGIASGVLLGVAGILAWFTVGLLSLPSITIGAAAALLLIAGLNPK